MDHQYTEAPNGTGIVDSTRLDPIADGWTIIQTFDLEGHADVVDHLRICAKHDTEGNLKLAVLDHVMVNAGYEYDPSWRHEISNEDEPTFRIPHFDDGQIVSHVRDQGGERSLHGKLGGLGDYWSSPDLDVTVPKADAESVRAVLEKWKSIDTLTDAFSPDDATIAAILAFHGTPTVSIDSARATRMTVATLTECELSLDPEPILVESDAMANMRDFVRLSVVGTRIRATRIDPNLRDRMREARISSISIIPAEMPPEGASEGDTPSIRARQHAGDLLEVCSAAGTGILTTIQNAIRCVIATDLSYGHAVHSCRRAGAEWFLWITQDGMTTIVLDSGRS